MNRPAAGLLVAAVLVGGSCSTKPAGIADPGSLDVSGVARLSLAECADLFIARSELTAARDPAGARAPSDAIRKFSPPEQVSDAIDFDVRNAGVTAKIGSDDGTRAYKTIDRWITAACPPPADRGEGTPSTRR